MMAAPSIALSATTTRPLYPRMATGGIYFMLQYKDATNGNAVVQIPFAKQQPTLRWDTVIVSNLPLVTPNGPAASGSRQLYISYDRFTFHVAKNIPDAVGATYTGAMDDYKNTSVAPPVYIRSQHSAFNLQRIATMLAMALLIGSIVGWFLLRKKR